MLHCRFKEHVQNNLPRDILPAEQFVQLRRELASSATSHNGEDAPPGDDLPSGTEEITDPAKVIAQRCLDRRADNSGAASSRLWVPLLSSSHLFLGLPVTFRFS